MDHVFKVKVMDLDTLQPVAGASILVYDISNDIVENGVTDANGRWSYSVGNMLSR